MSVLAWRSAFAFGTIGDPASFECSLTTRPWTRASRSVGGSRTASGGTPAAYVVRRDYVLVLALRILESEWPEFEALIEWGQSSETFTWYPDALDLGSSYEVWLESPLAGSAAQPERDGDYPSMLNMTIELRRADGEGAWDLDYFGSES